MSPYPSSIVYYEERQSHAFSMAKNRQKYKRKQSYPWPPTPSKQLGPISPKEPVQNQRILAEPQYNVASLRKHMFGPENPTRMSNQQIIQDKGGNWSLCKPNKCKIFQSMLICNPRIKDNLKPMRATNAKNRKLHDQQN